MIPRIEEIVLAMVGGFEESPIIIGVLILILVVGILSVVFSRAAQKLARKCQNEQEKLKIRLDDQMHLLGRYHQDLIRLGTALTELKDTVRRERASEAPTAPVSSTVAEVSPASDSEAQEGSMTVRKESQDEEIISLEQEISVAEMQEEDRKALMKEAREAARKADRHVIIASTMDDAHERGRLLPEVIPRRERAFARLRELEALHRKMGWPLPAERLEMSEVPDEDLREARHRFTDKTDEHEEGFGGEE